MLAFFVAVDCTGFPYKLETSVAGVKARTRALPRKIERAFWAIFPGIASFVGA